VPPTGVIFGSPLVTTSSAGCVASSTAGACAGGLPLAGNIGSGFGSALFARILLAAPRSAAGGDGTTAHAPPADSDLYQ